MKSLKNLLFGKEYDKQVAFVGLQNAGKTTLVKRIKEGTSNSSVVLNTKYVPTMGLSMETFKIGSYTEVIAADLGGQKSFIEAFWKPFVSKSAAVCFVFDSADVEKVKEAGEVLELVLSWVRPESTFLFLANKMDLPNALSLEDIIEKLGLQAKISQRPHSFGVYQCSALYGTGLEEAIRWLGEQLSKYHPESESNNTDQEAEQ